jgi:hypothetical protein
MRAGRYGKSGGSKGGFSHSILTDNQIKLWVKKKSVVFITATLLKCQWAVS